MSALDARAADAPRIAIHIGLKKSGSATIQTFLAANTEALRGMSVDYPEPGRGDRIAHHNVFSEIEARKAFEPTRGSLAQLVSYIAVQDKALTIISSEMLESLEPARIEALRTTLAVSDRHMQVVLVIRNLLDLVPSSYAQKIRYGQKHFDFDRFFATRTAQERVSYFTTASNWASVFGWENIRVRLLDPQFLLHGDLIDDFLAAVGLDADDPGLRALPRPGVINSASGWKVLEAVRALYVKKPSLPAGHRLIPILKHATTLGRRKKIERAAVEAGRRLGWQADRGLYLTRDQAQSLLDLYAESIMNLNQRLAEALPLPVGLAERGFVERRFLPKASHIPRDELIAFYDDLASTLSELKRLRRPPREGRESRRKVAPPPGVAA